MLVQLAPVKAAMRTHLLADHAPCALEVVGPRATRGKREFGAEDREVDGVCAARGEAQTAGVDLVEVGEDFEVDFGGEVGDGGVRCLGWEEGEAARHVCCDGEDPFVFGVGGVVAGGLGGGGGCA